MSDVRSLLKAKRQEIRVDHPLASYTSNGQLRCSVCDINIKHPSAWDGHLVSKTHRTNTARVKEEERRRKELELEEEAKRLKRKVPEDDINEDIGSTAKKTRVTPAPQPTSTSTLPPDFFSDPSRAPFPSSNDSDDEDETSAAAPITEPTHGAADSSLDQEWIQFQQSVINTPDAAATYDRATIFAEPELVSNPSEGFPTQDGPPAEPVAKADGDERRRKDQEERELIMDRLIDEERAQEEADMKVTIMKDRLAVLRKKRETARSAKPDVGVV
ncbi:hypothetical protein V8E55_003867 [Tylopilus felleus]